MLNKIKEHKCHFHRLILLSQIWLKKFMTRFFQTKILSKGGILMNLIMFIRLRIIIVLNKFKLNVAKMKELVFRSPHDQNVVVPPSLAGTDHVEHPKLLGVVINDCLAFSCQTDILLQTCNQRLYLIKNLYHLWPFSCNYFR